MSVTSSNLRIATVEKAAAVDDDPPLSNLLQAVQHAVENPEKGGCVAYWMRMGDLRSEYPFFLSFPYFDTPHYGQYPIIEP